MVLKVYYTRPKVVTTASQWNPSFVPRGRQQDRVGSARPPAPRRLVRSPGRHLLWQLPYQRSPAPRIWPGHDSGSMSRRIQSPPGRACRPLPPGGPRGSSLGAGGGRRQSPAPGAHQRSTLAAPTLGWGSSLAAPVSCLPHRPTRQYAGPQRGAPLGDLQVPFWWPPSPGDTAPPVLHGTGGSAPPASSLSPLPRAHARPATRPAG
jgi:hypothetical protein